MKNDLSSLAKIQKRTWQVLEARKSHDTLARVINYLILALICLNIIAVICSSVEWIFIKYDSLFKGFEIFSIAVFTVEYFARVWSCTADAKYAHSFRGRIAYMLSPMALCDFLAVSPFFIPFIVMDTRAIRILRLLRIIRLVRVGGYYSSLRLITAVLRQKKEELLISIVLMLVMLFLSACLMYYCENAAQPEKFSSIPQSMWWSVTTLTTVGYGDMYPVTPIGKLLTGILSILGIAMFALPTAIMGAGFIEEIQRRRHGARHCPHCGKEI